MPGRALLSGQSGRSLKRLDFRNSGFYRSFQRSRVSPPRLLHSPPNQHRNCCFCAGQEATKNTRRAPQQAPCTCDTLLSFFIWLAAATNCRNCQDSFFACTLQPEPSTIADYGGYHPFNDRRGGPAPSRKLRRNLPRAAPWRNRHLDPSQVQALADTEQFGGPIAAAC